MFLYHPLFIKPLHKLTVTDRQTKGQKDGKNTYRGSSYRSAQTCVYRKNREYQEYRGNGKMGNKRYRWKVEKMIKEGKKERGKGKGGNLGG